MFFFCLHRSFAFYEAFLVIHFVTDISVTPSMSVWVFLVESFSVTVKSSALIDKVDRSWSCRLSQGTTSSLRNAGTLCVSTEGTRDKHLCLYNSFRCQKSWWLRNYGRGICRADYSNTGSAATTVQFCGLLNLQNMEENKKEERNGQRQDTCTTARGSVTKKDKNNSKCKNKTKKQQNQCSSMCF